jgi:hypothetical protein
MANEQEAKVTSDENVLTEDRPSKIRWARGLREEQRRWFALRADIATTNRVSVGRLSGFESHTSIDIDAHEEHERTRQLISEKLAQLPQREDLLHAKEETIRELSGRIRELQTQLESTAADLVKSRELEACTTKLCDQIRIESEGTRTHLSHELMELRAYLSKFAPHKRFFRVTFGLLCFFLVSLIVYSTSGIRILEPFWAIIGVVLGVAMLIVIYFGMRDEVDKPAYTRTSPAE